MNCCCILAGSQSYICIDSRQIYFHHTHLDFADWSDLQCPYPLNWSTPRNSFQIGLVGMKIMFPFVLRKMHRARRNSFKTPKWYGDLYFSCLIIKVMEDIRFERTRWNRCGRHNADSYRTFKKPSGQRLSQSTC